MDAWIEPSSVRVVNNGLDFIIFSFWFYFLSLILFYLKFLFLFFILNLGGRSGMMSHVTVTKVTKL